MVRLETKPAGDCSPAGTLALGPWPWAVSCSNLLVRSRRQVEVNAARDPDELRRAAAREHVVIVGLDADAPALADHHVHAETATEAPRLVSAALSAGAHRANPNAKLIVSYIGNWDDVSAGKEQALAQMTEELDKVEARQK